MHRSAIDGTVGGNTEGTQPFKGDLIKRFLSEGAIKSRRFVIGDTDIVMWREGWINQAYIVIVIKISF